MDMAMFGFHVQTVIIFKDLNMKNLVIGLATGYSVDRITPFVTSFRQHSQDNLLFVTDNLSDDMVEFCEKNQIYTIIPNEPLQLHTCQIKRYEIYLDCLESHFLDVANVLISDVRDVIFQSNPFSEYPKKSLEFFAEPEFFKNCKHNAPWVAGIYGKDRAQEIFDQYVICSGTTMGTRQSMVAYLTSMVNEIKRLSDMGRPLSGGEDQPVHNHLVYDNKFTDFNINQNGSGPICTMHHAKVLTFNRAGQLLNDDGSVIPVVHQYDRCGPMSVVFVKNALKGYGREGIIAAATHAANNFAAHDLG
jgi:hypothetical protein